MKRVDFQLKDIILQRTLFSNLLFEFHNAINTKHLIYRVTMPVYFIMEIITTLV